MGSGISSETGCAPWWKGIHQRTADHIQIELGTYKVRCAELCGTSHYAMVADVIVVNQQGFRDWVAESQKGCDLGSELCGQRWATNYGCFSCHSVDGTELVGPTWLGLAGSNVQADDGNSYLVDDAYLRECNH